jgi:hypothetical protein
MKGIGRILVTLILFEAANIGLTDDVPNLIYLITRIRFY